MTSVQISSVGVLVLILILGHECNSSTCKYLAHTQLLVLKNHLDLAWTRLFVFGFCTDLSVWYSTLVLLCTVKYMHFIDLTVTEITDFICTLLVPLF